MRLAIISVFLGRTSAYLGYFGPQGPCTKTPTHGTQLCCMGALDDPSQCSPPSSSILTSPYMSLHCQDVGGSYCPAGQILTGNPDPVNFEEYGGTCSTGNSFTRQLYNYTCCECGPGRRPASPCNIYQCIGCTETNEILKQDLSGAWSCIVPAASSTLTTTTTLQTTTSTSNDACSATALNKRATGPKGDPAKPCPLTGQCKTTQAVIDWLLRPGGEDFKPNFYNIDGDQTIGFGHDCTKNKDCNQIHPPITRAQGMALFKKDMASKESCVGHTRNAEKLNINQFSALTSLTYNTGCAGFRTSTVGRAIIAGDFDQALAAFPTCHIKGFNKKHKLVVFPGLITRRKHEAMVFNSSSEIMSGCPGAPKPS